MPTRLRVGFVLAALAAGAAGCGTSNPPAPTADSGTDVNGTDVTDVGDGGDGGGACPSIEFVHPTQNQVLGVADNLSHDCASGFTYNVQVATNAIQGTALELLVGGRIGATATVNGPTVTFANVSLDTHATSMLAVRVAGTTMACATESISTICATPRCTILRPDHSTLTSADNTRMGGGFGASFVIGTDVDDGQPVQLTVSNLATPLMATATGGMATFPGVAFATDGDYRVQAQCTDRAGNVGRSTSTVYTVAATLPTLTVSRPMGGAVIGLSSDVDPRAGLQFNVCAQSNAAGQQVCAEVSGSMPDSPQGCATVPASATTDACVQVTCPTGGAPFDVVVTVQDSHGNPTRVTVPGIRCESMLPSVRIVAPAALVPGDASTYLNIAHDADPATPGLQVDVVACADRMSGMATLFANDAALGTVVTVMPTAAGDPCAALGMGFVGIARFPHATLPDTTPEVITTAQIAGITRPQIRVEVRDDAGDLGRSATQTEYVDSQTPVVTLPTPGCGALIRAAAGATSVTQDVSVLSGGIFPVDLTIRHPDGRIESRRATSAGTASGQALFSMVNFELGDSTLTATATDPAGNPGTSAAGCIVHVGNPPRVSITTPTDGQIFSAVGDTGTPGTGYHSAPVTVTTDAPVGTVLTLNVPGNAPVTATVADASGTLSFGPQVLPEGSYAITVTTADVTGRGVGMASVHVVVDTQAPGSPGGLVATVSSRRGGVIQLAFTDASDPNPVTGGAPRAVQRYEVRFSNAAITAANYATANLATVTVTPGAPGTANTVNVTGLHLETTYFFAIRSFDAAGNGSPLTALAATGGTPLDLVRDVFTETSSGLGSQVSGGYDVNGDSFADMVVATSLGQARIYFGSATGLSATRYALIADTSSTGFGSAAVSLGDFNGDGVGDVAVAAPRTGSGAGAVYVYLGRAGRGTGPMARSWPVLPASLAAVNADLTITTDAVPAYATGAFGLVLARVGDFNCDGLADLAASAPLSGTGASATRPGSTLVIFGRATVPGTLSIPSAASVVINNSAAGQIFMGLPLASGGYLVGSDRCDDLLVTSRSGTDTTMGTVSVFAGRTVASPPLMLASTDAAFSTTGATILQAFPAAGIGDVNGDGRSDFAVGSLGSRMVTNPASRGQVSLFLSGTTAGTFTRVDVPGTVNTLGFGYAMAGLWDATVVHPSLLVPTPTAADLVAGANSWQGGAPRVSIWSGRATLTGLNPDMPEAFKDTVGTGSASPTSSVNWVGDVDHDGFPDLGVGQPAQGSFLYIH